MAKRVSHSRGRAAFQGISSKDFVAELGYVGSEEIVHRDNICLLTPPPGNASDAALSAQDTPQPGKHYRGSLHVCESHEHTCTWQFVRQ